MKYTRHQIDFFRDIVQQYDEEVELHENMAMELFWRIIANFSKDETIKKGTDYLIDSENKIMSIRISKVYDLYKECMIEEIIEKPLTVKRIIELLPKSKEYLGLEKAVRFNDGVHSAHRFIIK